MTNRDRAKCADCGRPIYRSGSGASWMHPHNASSSCYPGTGSRKRANPQEVGSTR